MKGLLFRALFCPPDGGKSGAAGKGEASAASQSAEWFSSPMTQKSKFRNVLASPLGEEGHKVAKGVQANWIHRGAPRPANPVRRHPAKSVWTVVILIMILDVDVTVAGGIIKRIAPLKGKRLTTFCASLRSFKSFKMCSLCVASPQEAANWRSGPRWSILSVLCPVHPFPLRGTSPQGETRK